MLTPLPTNELEKNWQKNRYCSPIKTTKKCIEQ